MTDDSSESGDGLIAPVGSDESLNSSPEQQSRVPQPSSEPQKSSSVETDRVDKEGCDEDDDKTISDAESESLLNHARASCSRQSSSETNEAAENARFSVAVQTIKKECEEFSIQANHFPEEEDVNGSFLQESCTEHAPSPRHSSPKRSSGADLTVNLNGVAPSEPMNVTVDIYSAPSPPLFPPPPHEDPANDSAGFWRKCNAAKCTQVLFSDFIRWITILSRRIQADEASQEDYERALSVMKASGQLENIVVAQQKDLQRRLTELQTAAAAMEEVVSALR
ncbi:uncharacterized protein phf11 isoform X4 [Oryzias latipes]